MANGIVFLGAALGVVVLTTGATAPAQQQASTVQNDCPEAGDTTNQKLLDALVKRRAEVARAGSPAKTRDARAFLDQRIAEMRARIAACATAG